MRFDELKSGYKLLWNIDDNKNQYVLSVQKLTNNIVTISHIDWCINAVHLKEDNCIHTFSIKLFIKVICNGQIYDLER